MNVVILVIHVCNSIFTNGHPYVRHLCLKEVAIYSAANEDRGLFSAMQIPRSHLFEKIPLINEHLQINFPLVCCLGMLELSYRFQTRCNDP